MKNILQAITKEEMPSIQIIDLKQGQILFMEGEECLNVGIVIEGEIEIVSYTFNGKEIIFNQLGPGMMFANNLIFSSDPHYKGSIIAKKPAKVALYIIASEGAVCL